MVQGAPTCTRMDLRERDQVLDVKKWSLAKMGCLVSPALASSALAPDELHEQFRREKVGALGWLGSTN